MAYDGVRRMVGIEHRKPDQTLFSGYDYAYDRTANRLFERDLVLNSADAYNYDSKYRLTDVIYEAAGNTVGVISNNANASVDLAVVGGSHEVWSLDGVGNWMERTDEVATTIYAAGEMNEYKSVGEIARAHDKNGKPDKRW